MLERFVSILQQNCFLSPKKTILVGVSGGADSLCLLDLFSRTKYPVVIAHLNHGLRPEAEADAEFVKSITERLGIPFILGEEDVTAHAERFGLSIEEAARHLRYKFLFDHAKIVGAQAVAVAHHADDQIETVLMHLLRGSGLAGLRGMRHWSLPNPWSEEIPLVRPMLDIWREEIDTYLLKEKIEPTQDKTNLDTKMFRNRLRHELIPYLSSYNPGIRKALWRMSQVLDADYETLEEIADSAWVETQTDQGPGYVSLRYSALIAQPISIQRQIIRKGISMQLPGLRDIEFDTVERALTFLKIPTRSRRLGLAAGVYILLEDELIWLANETAVLPEHAWPQIPGQDQHCDEPSLKTTGSIKLEHGWILECYIHPFSPEIFQQALDNTDMFQACMDASRVRFPLTVCCRKPGERFQPAGMEGHSLKVSDFMINVKMPVRARDRWPLIFSDGRLVWIPGYRMDHSTLVSDTTQQVLHLRLFRKE